MYTHIYIYICIHIWIYTCIYIYVYMYKYVYIYIYVCIHMYVCIYKYKCTYMYEFKYMYKYVWLYIYIHSICININICIHNMYIYIYMYKYVYIYIYTWILDQFNGFGNLNMRYIHGWTPLLLPRYSGRMVNNQSNHGIDGASFQTRRYCILSGWYVAGKLWRYCLAPTSQWDRVLEPKNSKS